MQYDIHCVVLSLSLLVSPVVAQGPDTDSRFAPASSASMPVPSLTAVDRHLQKALQAPNPADRKAALRAAQGRLDALAQAEGAPAVVTGVDIGKDDGPQGRVVPYGTTGHPKVGEGKVAPTTGWQANTERTLARLEADTRRSLRQTLMRSIWQSPYQEITAKDLSVLEQISDALRLIKELKRIRGGDPTALVGLQGIYWGWLMDHRARQGLSQTALAESDDTPVLDQRVVRGDDGRVHIYQLTGSKDKTLRWAVVAPASLPKVGIGYGSLILDLSRETAPLLLVLEGKGLARQLDVHRHWLEAVQEEVRIVLLAHGDYVATLQTLPSQWFAPGRRLPYVLPGQDPNAEAVVRLVDVANREEIGQWPLANLTGTHAEALKGLINRIIAAVMIGFENRIATRGSLGPGK